MDEVRSQMSGLDMGPQNEDPECFYVGGSTTPPVRRVGKAHVQTTANSTHLDASGTPNSGDADKPRGLKHVDTPLDAMLPSKIVAGEPPKARGRMRVPSGASTDHLTSTDGAMVCNVRHHHHHHHHRTGRCCSIKKEEDDGQCSTTRPS